MGKPVNNSENLQKVNSLFSKGVNRYQENHTLYRLSTFLACQNLNKNTKNFKYYKVIFSVDI